MKIRMLEAEDINKKVAEVGDEAEENGASSEEAAQLEKDTKKAILDLDITVGKDVVTEVDGEDGEIEKILTDALKTAILNKKYGEESNANVLLVGPGGIGKTSRSRKWANDHNVNLVEIDAKVLDAADIGGIVARDDNDKNVATKLSITQFDELDKPGSVLFLDEYNRADDEVRGSLLELIQSHRVNDNRVEGKKRELRGFLFTIASINPPNPTYKTKPLDGAERSRFQVAHLEGNVVDTLNHYKDTFDKKIARAEKEGNEEEALRWKNVKGMAEHLIMWGRDPKNGDVIDQQFAFHFSSKQEEIDAMEKQLPITNPRSLLNLLNSLHSGKKEELIRKWDSFCYPGDLKIVEEAMADYEDIDDEANAVHDFDVDAAGDDLDQEELARQTDRERKRGLLFDLTGKN